MSSKMLFDKPLTVSIRTLLSDRSPSQPHEIVAAKIEGKLIDLMDHYTLPSGENASDVAVEWIRANQPEGLAIIRHSCAHLLGHAIKQWFPESKMAIGPVIKEGFYYDVELTEPLNEEQLKHLQERMQQLAQTDYRVEKRWVTWEEAFQIFQMRNEPYKLEILETQVPRDKPVSLYYHQEYVDMCLGPHVPRMGFCQYFHLTHSSGAYWRGQHDQQSLQRIYGTAWDTPDRLEAYQKQQLEKQGYDHRTLAKKLELLHFQQVAPGCAFWHPNGTRVLRILRNFIREKLEGYGYEEVQTPQLMSRTLWEKSAHWSQFGENMFVTGTEGHTFAIKPMSCPGHIQIYNKNLHSYKNLPLRLAEFGCCHRNESSGALHGLMRARAFTQDDAHIFCTPEQVQSEILSCIQMAREVYASFGFQRIQAALSTRPKQHIGSAETWDFAEATLEQALQAAQLSYKIQKGGGAFYGPKIEFVFTDVMGREWQCGTIQVDFQMPHRLEANYIDAAGKRQPVILLHRAIMGSLERFLGILLENYKGDLPLWLAPIQIAFLPVSDSFISHIEPYAKMAQQHGLRVFIDRRSEKLDLKIRDNTLKRTPYLIVFGAKESQTGDLSVRLRSGERFKVQDPSQFFAMLAANDRCRAMRLYTTPTDCVAR